MNSTNDTATGSVITWKRAKQATRLKRVTRMAFRVTWNVLAVLGVCFIYLLVTGYAQYQDQVAQSEVQCAASRCM
ncbi:hypothetical protein [Burkholderia lata]|uniref:hypothetical protein n=1 Tax=Burkholderia lata (strain ATCC 17760 / DSM 23089 / LMG 22485 / NCIMB 9086 / R18194 / 383) TaxID=482957 RepID=UPI0002D7A3AF|nr:hypothetical protein [Burkholderia lata]